MISFATFFLLFLQSLYWMRVGFLQLLKIMWNWNFKSCEWDILFLPLSCSVDKQIKSVKWYEIRVTLKLDNRKTRVSDQVHISLAARVDSFGLFNVKTCFFYILFLKLLWWQSVVNLSLMDLPMIDHKIDEAKK